VVSWGDELDVARSFRSGFSRTVRCPPAGIVVTFPHWLVVSLFALFYGVLKWVYRKREKAVADE